MTAEPVQPCTHELTVLNSRCFDCVEKEIRDLENQRDVWRERYVATDQDRLRLANLKDAHLTRANRAEQALADARKELDYVNAVLADWWEAEADFIASDKRYRFEHHVKYPWNELRKLAIGLSVKRQIGRDAAKRDAS